LFTFYLCVTFSAVIASWLAWKLVVYSYQREIFSRFEGNESGSCVLCAWWSILPARLPTNAQHYTTERISQGAVLPPPPVQSVFTVFGEEYRLEDDIIRSLASQNIKQLYPAKYDWKTEMKKLNRSVVVAFLDLLDILVRCPDHPERNEKINDIQTIFINMHHLINEYRPLQARDTLRMMQSQQLKELKKTVKRFKGHLAAGKAALREELSLSDLKLTPVPRPSPLTGIDIDSDEENMPTLIKMEVILEFVFFYSLSQAVKPHNSLMQFLLQQHSIFLSEMEEATAAMSTMRLAPRPSRVQLKQRRNAEARFLNEC
ncbi:MED7 protein, partial [Cooperia oncophora]